MTRSQKMAPDLRKVGLLALMCCVNGASASIFEPASPLNIVPGTLESEVFESTDSEILRRDLYNEDNEVYGGPYDFLWFEKDKNNENNNYAYLQTQMYNVDNLGEYFTTETRCCLIKITSDPITSSTPVAASRNLSVDFF